MPHDADLVLLQDCLSHTEASGLRALLSSHGIRCVVQAEHHAALLGTAWAIGPITPRVLVPRSELVRARELLDAEVRHEAAGTPLEGGICAVHEQPAVVTCSRCGNFLCANCTSLGEPPVCESCQEAEAVLAPPASAGARPQLYVLAFGALVVGLAVLYDLLRP